MIHLPIEHKVLADTLTQLLLPVLNPTRLDEHFADFDGVSYHVSTPVSKTSVVVSMYCACFHELLQYGALTVLQREYGNLLISKPENGFHVSLEIDLERISSEASEKGNIFCLFL